MWPHLVALLHFLGLVLCCFVAVCLIVGGLRLCVCLNGKIKLPAGFRRRLYSTGELKKNGSPNLYYTRQRAGKDMGRLPCALLGQCTEPFFFYNAVSVKTLILGHFVFLELAPDDIRERHIFWF